MKRVLFVLFSLLFISSAHAEMSSMAQLLASGQSVECSFQKTDGSQKGTVFVAGEKLRGEFVMSEGGSEYTMHMIRDTEKMFTWGGPMGETQGMILPAGLQGASPMGGPQTADLQETMDFSCNPWPADASRFEPPSDVVFQDMGEMMSALAAAQSGNLQ